MGNVTSRTNPRNHVTEMSYDALGRLLTMTEAKSTANERSVSYLGGQSLPTNLSNATACLPSR